MQKSKIVQIPETMEKFFGKGTMLHPTVNQVEDLVRLIPKGKITTIGNITSYLAAAHGTKVTCPMRTGNAIKKLSERFSVDDLDQELPFWRVLRKDHLMIKSKNYEQLASVIEDEGFEISFTKSNNIKVKVGEGEVFSFS